MGIWEWTRAQVALAAAAVLAALTVAVPSVANAATVTRTAGALPQTSDTTPWAPIAIVAAVGVAILVVALLVRHFRRH